MNNGQNIQSYSITEYRRNVGIYGERIILRLAQLAYECVMNTNPDFDFSSGEIPRIDYGNLPAMRKGYSITPINTPRWKYFNVSIPVHDIMPKGDDSHYRILREHIKGIASIVLETVEDDSKNARIYHLVNEVDTEKGIIYLNLREEVWQAMLDFSKGYRYYDIDKTFTLNSAYSVRFYLLMAGQKQALNFSMENLRKMLALEEKYKNSNDFIKRVIKVAKEELDAKMPYSFTYQTENKKSVSRGKPSIDSITLNPVHIPKNEKEENTSASLRRQITLFGFDRETHDLLFGYYEFSTAEVQNNLDLFMKANKKLPLAKTLSELKPKAGRAANQKGYVIQTLRNLIQDEPTLL